MPASHTVSFLGGRARFHASQETQRASRRGSSCDSPVGDTTSDRTARCRVTQTSQPHSKHLQIVTWRVLSGFPNTVRQVPAVVLSRCQSHWRRRFQEDIFQLRFFTLSDSWAPEIGPRISSSCGLVNSSVSGARYHGTQMDELLFRTAVNRFCPSSSMPLQRRCTSSRP